MINVPEEKIERFDALLDAAVELLPVRGGDNSRDDVEGQDAVDGGPVAINGKGNSKRKKLAFGVLRALAKLCQLKLLEMVPEGREVLGFLRTDKLAIIRAGIVLIERRRDCRIPECCDRRHAKPFECSSQLSFTAPAGKTMKDDDKSGQTLAQQRTVPEHNFGLK